MVETNACDNQSSNSMQVSQEEGAEGDETDEDKALSQVEQSTQTETSSDEVREIEEMLLRVTMHAKRADTERDGYHVVENKAI